MHDSVYIYNRGIIFDHLVVKHEACAGRQIKRETNTAWSSIISIIFGCSNKVPTKQQSRTNLTRHGKKKQSKAYDEHYQCHYIGICPEGLARITLITSLKAFMWRMAYNTQMYKQS